MLSPEAARMVEAPRAVLSFSSVFSVLDRKQDRSCAAASFGDDPNPLTSIWPCRTRCRRIRRQRLQDLLGFAR